MGEAVDIAFIFLVFVTIVHPFLVENDQFSSTISQGAVQGWKMCEGLLQAENQQTSTAMRDARPAANVPVCRHVYRLDWHWR